MTPHEPNPYKALERVMALRPAQQRSLLRLVVTCERDKCTPIRVFGLRDGLLVQCRSDADVRDLQGTYPHLDDWSRRRAFFLDWWLSDENDSTSRLQIVCGCLQTKARLVDVHKIADLTPAAGERPRRVALNAVLAHGA